MQPGDPRIPASVHGAGSRYQTDHNRHYMVLLYESGVGASHQTGWIGLVGKLLQQSGE